MLTMGELASHERYANFYTDFAFKKLFGSEANKECLEERRDYRESQKDFWDLFAVTETAEKKGRAEERIEIAKKLKALGIPAETIAQSTGLAIDEINEL